MRLLPDTQLLIWIADRAELLPPEAEVWLKDEANEISFSLVSIWELSIKYALRQPDFTVEPRALRRGLLALGFLEVPILDEHVIHVSKLPHHHRDPFDRLLVAQAEIEGLTLMTTDKQLTQYGPHVQRFR